MKTIAAKLSLKFNIFSRKRQFKHIPVPNDDFEDIENFRTRGSEILKSIPIASESTTTRSPSIRSCSKNDYALFNTSDKTETDWHETDKKVSKFQQQQKKKQQQQRIEDFKEQKSSNGSERQNKVKKLKHLKRTIELARRKRLDNKGSFAINMVTYRDHKNKTSPNINEKGEKGKDSVADCPAANIIMGSGCDDRSRSSVSTCLSNDFTLQVIDEEIVYYNE